MTPVLDFIGSIFSFLSTYNYVRLNVLAWPLGLVAILIDMVLFYKNGIYGDVLLHIFYFILTLYGWYRWYWIGDESKREKVKNIPIKAGLLLIPIMFVLFIFLVMILEFYTNSQVPYWDASTTVLSLIAQWMTCRKYIQNWMIWFVVDVMYSGLFFYKGIPAHGCLYIVYVAMAVIGYFQWKKAFSIGHQCKPFLVEAETV